MIVSGINDYYYEIVFYLEINNKTYDFNNNKYIHNSTKNFYLSINIIFHIFILIFLIFCLIFIEIPIIRNKKNPKNKGRLTKIKEKIENNEEQFDINERFTADPV